MRARIKPTHPQPYLIQEDAAHAKLRKCKKGSGGGIQKGVSGERDRRGKGGRRAALQPWTLGEGKLQMEKSKQLYEQF